MTLYSAAFGGVYTEVIIRTSSHIMMDILLHVYYVIRHFHNHVNISEFPDSAYCTTHNEERAQNIVHIYLHILADPKVRMTMSSPSSLSTCNMIHP